MGKASPRNKESMAFRQKRRSKNVQNRYLKPGALAQLRDSKATCRPCTDIGKKRVLVLDSGKVKRSIVRQSKLVDDNPLLMSPERVTFLPLIGLIDELKQHSLPGTPKTPQTPVRDSASALESLPLEILVKIMCHLHHDQLKAVFHVSQRIRSAVLLARQFHFNYTTPDRSRQEMLSTKTPLPREHWPFLSNGDGKGIWGSRPHTPKAPRHGPRPSRVPLTEMRQITAALFQESNFAARYMRPPGLPKPLCRSLASNRVLFYEDELCQAVAQNRLR